MYSTIYLGNIIDQIYERANEELANGKNEFIVKIVDRFTKSIISVPVSFVLKTKPTDIQDISEDLKKGYEGIVTYIRDKEGNLIAENYGGNMGIARFDEKHDIILSNQEVLAKGFFYKDANNNKCFREDINGTDLLYNSWLSNRDYITTAYHVPLIEDLSIKKPFVKQEYGVAIKIDLNEPYGITLSLNGIPHNFKNGDYIVIQGKNNNFSMTTEYNDAGDKVMINNGGGNIMGVQEDIFLNTYSKLEEFKELEKKQKQLKIFSCNINERLRKTSKEKEDSFSTRRSFNVTL